MDQDETHKESKSRFLEFYFNTSLQEENNLNNTYMIQSDIYVCIYFDDYRVIKIDFELRSVSYELTRLDDRFYLMLDMLGGETWLREKLDEKNRRAG